ncbi:uncharacterized protein AB675_8473 [Cyphellophora attinorum]|uniref:GATA-type domain-containing protein n=1 Tax=Cyphellophora attinorum TaxID=1664694 RepID=A0A0N1P1K3_9EURO|nr:uncharacterized protein AB675_8473 [Phialophora attinorum]KPI44530.1 hypothetical protein AB675_8473 [Phialophora attinorum]
MPNDRGRAARAKRHGGPAPDERGSSDDGDDSSEVESIGPFDEEHAQKVTYRLSEEARDTDGAERHADTRDEEADRREQARRREATYRALDQAREATRAALPYRGGYRGGSRHEDAPTTASRPSPMTNRGHGRHAPEPQGVCQKCGTRETSRWRPGPSGSKTLCNACYRRWVNQGRPRTLPRAGDEQTSSDSDEDGIDKHLKAGRLYEKARAGGGGSNFLYNEYQREQARRREATYNVLDQAREANRAYREGFTGESRRESASTGTSDPSTYVTASTTASNYQNSPPLPRTGPGYQYQEPRYWFNTPAVGPYANAYQSNAGNPYGQASSQGPASTAGGRTQSSYSDSYYDGWSRGCWYVPLSQASATSPKPSNTELTRREYLLYWTKHSGRKHFHGQYAIYGPEPWSTNHFYRQYIYHYWSEPWPHGPSAAAR